MYVALNQLVVNATNAVRTTKTTLRSSTRRYRPASGRSKRRCVAAASVTALATALSRDVTTYPGNNASAAAAASGPKITTVTASIGNPVMTARLGSDPAL